jgi:malonyl-CoA O-methyltransferase
LPQNGVLAVSGFGPETLKEVMQLSGRGLDYLDFDAFTQCFTEWFTPLACDQRRCTLRFEDGWDVLRHLKETGVTATGAAERALWTRQRLATFVTDYKRLFATPDGGVQLTYEPFWFVGAKK